MEENLKIGSRIFKKVEAFLPNQSRWRLDFDNKYSIELFKGFHSFSTDTTYEVDIVIKNDIYGCWSYQTEKDIENIIKLVESNPPYDEYSQSLLL